MSLHDRYELRHRIGDGGMAEVWLAHDRRLDRPVAVKLIPGASEVQIGREAQAAARLVHPNIAGIYDFGDGFLVMELLSGSTLADRLHAGPLPWPQAARIGAGVATALAAAHAHGIVHRDIKPANIMLTATGVKVLDFGIAAAAHRDRDDATIAGTPGYAAPERLSDAPADPASDVYSLAVVVCEMVTGTLPRAIGSWSELARADFHRPAAVPAGLRPQIASLLTDALHGDAARRPTAASLVEAFDAEATRAGSSVATAGGRSVPAPRTSGGASPTLVTALRTSGVAAIPPPRPAPTTVADPTVLGTGRPPAIRIGIIAATVVLVLLAALAGYSTLHYSNAASATPPATTTTSTPATGPDDSASPSGSPSSGVDGLLASLAQTVDTASTDGSLDHDMAKDLPQLVQRIQDAWQRGGLNEFRDQCQQLRDALQNGGDNGDQGGSANPTIQAINDLVTQLLAAAGPAA